MTNNYWRQIDIRAYAVAASLLISCYTILFPDTPNDDAFVYIRAAEVFQSQGLEAAFSQYSWAAYSVLIAIVGQLFSVDFFTSAYLINAVFFALLTFSFISVIKEIENSELLLLLGALTILLYPQLNEYRYLIIRDAGFWAFAVFGLWQFLLFSRRRQTKNALGYVLAMAAAAALRLEALLYLLITPLTLLFDTRFALAKCRQDFFRLEGLLLITLLALIAVAWLLGIDLLNQVREFSSTYLPFVIDLFNPNEAESFELASALFNEHAASYTQDYVNLFMLAGFGTILIIKLLDGIGIPLLFMLLMGAYKRILFMPRPVFLPVLSYLLVNSAVLLVFVYVTQFLSSRYTILFCIVMALFIPIILQRFLNWGLHNDRLQLTKYLTALFFIYCTVDVFVSFGVNKDYVQDSVDWLAANTPASAALVTNNASIAYFSKRVENYDQTRRLISTAEIVEAKPGTILAVELFYEMQQLLASDKISNLLEFQAGFPESDTDQQAIAIFKKVGQ